MRKFSFTAALAACLAALPAPAGAAPAGRELSRHGSWLVIAGEETSPVCFAVTQPRASEPAVPGRGAAHVYVSAWPRDGIRAEVSVSNGYAFRKGSTVTLTVGAIGFSLFTAGDRAFVADPTAELKLIDAMKKGSTLVVQGVNGNGIVTRDTYALNGLTQAITALTHSCG